MHHIRIYKPQRQKTNLWTCTPSEDSDQLRILAFGLEFSLGAFWIVKEAKFLRADNEDYADSQADPSSSRKHASINFIPLNLTFI